MKKHVQMYIHWFFTFSIIFLLVGCFGEKEEDSEDLFNNHQVAENKFVQTLSANKTYVEDDFIYIYLTHSYSLTVTNTPRVQINIGGSSVYADYFSGDGTSILLFRYQIQAGENDTDGISITNTIDLNGGQIEFTEDAVVTAAELTFDAINSSNLLVDTSAPLITTFIPAAPKTYFKDQSLYFSFTYDSIVEVVGTPQLRMDIGSTVYADYISGSGSNTLMFKKTVLATEVDTNGITISSEVLVNGGSIKDQAGNSADKNFTISAANQLILDNVELDGETPYVTHVTPPTNNTYNPGDDLYITLTFSETVTVTNTPRLSVDIGGDTVYFEYDSGDNSDELIFHYNINIGDHDEDGIELPGIIDLNGGDIQDLLANSIYLNITEVQTPNIFINGEIPEVASITPPADNLYDVPDQIFFVLHYNTPVTITLANPRLAIDIDGVIYYAIYVSGSDSANIYFRYDVPGGLQDLDGIEIQLTLDNNGASIKSAIGIDATPDLTTAVTALDTSAITIDSLP